MNRIISAIAVQLISITLFASSRNLVNYVNPIIGTGGHGHTFPGATLPFGMVQLSPDTRTLGWDACSGYHYSDSSIIGFSHTHLSGVGIGDYGDILFMPFSGIPKIVAGSPENPDTGFRSRFSHKEEIATPGYYKVKLSDYNIWAELTTTDRVGFHRYRYEKGGSSGVIIDLTHTIHGHKNPVNEIRIISSTEIEGLKRTEGWATNHFVFFRAKFSKPFTFKLFKNDTEVSSGSLIKSQNSKAILSFQTAPGEEVMIKVGISSVDFEGAKNNLEREVKDWNFDKIKNNAAKRWNDQLSKIVIEDSSEKNKIVFYTSLYHCFINPSLFSDLDGRYRGMDRKIHQTKTFPIYTVFSLWDTFRALHPLLTIVDPKKDNDFMNTLLSKYDEGGVLPKWELASNYTGTMIGYHAVSVIVDAYMKGIRNYDIGKAFKAIVESSHYDTTCVITPSRIVMNKLVSKDKYYNNKYGFIPSDSVGRSVSIALEYAYNDWCIAQMAKSLGYKKEFEEYSERALRYKQYYDTLTGFMRGKTMNGEWQQPFNPRHSTHGKTDYVEGNAWQWTWFAPHDIPGLVNLMGGKDKFITKLDSLFSISSYIEGEKQAEDVTGLIGMYAHGNEPSHHITYLYNYVNQSWKTQQLVDSILTTLYMNNPAGISGNEDCGQMSAWYVLSSLGFYSVCPGNPIYTIGRPLFHKAKIILKNGKTFEIETINNSPKNKYIQCATLNGKILNKPFFSHCDLEKGGKLVFVMGINPLSVWGALVK